MSDRLSVASVLTDNWVFVYWRMVRHLLAANEGLTIHSVANSLGTRVDKRSTVTTRDQLKADAHSLTVSIQQFSALVLDERQGMIRFSRGCFMFIS